MLHLRYGNHQHQPGEVEYARSRETQYTDDDQPMIVRDRWDLNGWLIGTSTTDIQNKLRTLVTAYGRHNQRIGLFDDAGNMLIGLQPSETISGIKVTRPPSLPDNRNAAHVTFLPYAITVEGEIPIQGSANMVVEFNETLDFEGGGPLFGHVETIDTLPQKQRRRAATVYRAVQQGEAVGLFSRPVVPAPLWPSALVGFPRVRKGRPVRRGNALTLWPVSWSYVFESATPLFGEPHFWGAV